MKTLNGIRKISIKEITRKILIDCNSTIEMQICAGHNKVHPNFSSNFNDSLAKCNIANRTTGIKIAKNETALMKITQYRR